MVVHSHFHPDQQTVRVERGGDAVGRWRDDSRSEPVAAILIFEQGDSGGGSVSGSFQMRLKIPSETRHRSARESKVKLVDKNNRTVRVRLQAKNERLRSK